MGRNSLNSWALLDTHTTGNDLQTAKGQDENGFPKSSYKAVWGDLDGNLWTPNKEELVPLVKLRFRTRRPDVKKTRDSRRVLVGYEANLNV